MIPKEVQSRFLFVNIDNTYCKYGSMKAIGVIHIKKNPEDYYVLAKPLSIISDEELEHINDLIKNEYNFSNGVNSWKHVEYQLFTKSHAIYSGKAVLKVSDYLRCNGYALPYERYTVEQFIECGILRIINDE